MSSIHDPEKLSCSDNDDGLAAASCQELAELTQEAMRRLGERQRMVLSLRFYEDMSHGEIARVLGCTEFHARVLFFRAKQAIVKQLKRLGVKRTALLAALVAFGQMTLDPTSASAATVSVSSAALAESLITGLLTAKVKVAVAAVVLLSVVGTWAFLNQRGAARSVKAPATPGQPSANLNPVGLPRVTATPQPTDTTPLYIHMVHRSMSLGAIQGSRSMVETWLYLPEGPEGPLMRRRVPMEEEVRATINWDVETADMNYHVYGATSEVHIENARAFCPELHTEMLPTDPSAMRAFVAAMEAEVSHAMVDKKGFAFEYDPATDFVIGATDTRFKKLPACRTTVEYNPPMQTDPFMYEPPANLKVVDDRDAMHKRGWTYFRVAGQLGGEAVAGVGRVPFTYAAKLTKPMWLRLRIGERFVLSDDGREALVRDQTGAVRLALAGGSFFKGMCRPWEGFHTLDQVRRDLARGAYGYTTSRWVQEGKLTIRVLRDTETTILVRSGGGALYVIDRYNDLLESVRYWPETEADPACEMQFTYLDSVDGLGEEFAPPETAEAGPADAMSGGTPLWPLDLVTQLEFEPAGQPR